jgi:hypothetical protein
MGDNGSWLYEVVGVGYLFGLLVGKVLLFEVGLRVFFQLAGLYGGRILRWGLKVG